MFRGLQVLFLLIISPFLLGLLLYGLKHKGKVIGKVILSFYVIGTIWLVSVISIGILSQKRFWINQILMANT
jgi:hypothetical protein